MISIKTSKLTAVSLLMAVLIGFGQTTPPVRPLEGDVEYQMYVKGSHPKVGEIFEIVFRVRLKEDNHLYLLSDEIIQQGYMGGFSVRSTDPVEISNKETFISTLIPGEWQEFSTQCLITKPANDVMIYGSIRLAAYKRGPILGRHLWLLDPETGQYGTREEWVKRAVNVLWKYDNTSAEWLANPDFRWEAGNRKIAEEMRKFEPALTDSEALCLHKDNYFLIINAIGDSTATDSERIDHLLKAGWLEAQRAGAKAKEKWLNDFMEKNRRRWDSNSRVNMLYLK